MYENHIADVALAPEGEKKIRWVAGHMPVLAAIAEDFRETKPLAGLRVALSVHLEAKTAWLCRVMEMGGAEMHVTGSNPLSTQDDVAAALAAGGMHVCAVHGATGEQYQSAIDAVLETAPNIIIDDGGDLVHRMHTNAEKKDQHSQNHEKVRQTLAARIIIVLKQERPVAIH